MGERKPFVAPGEGKAPRFSTGQKVVMILGIVFVALSLASLVLGMGVHH